MPFLQSDFTPENAQRLSIIIMSRLNKDVLNGFSGLSKRDKDKFNKLLNMYIKTELNCDNWEEVLLADVNDLIYDNVFTEKFTPESYTPFNTNLEASLLMTEEQREWKEQEDAKKAEAPLTAV